MKRKEMKISVFGRTSSGKSTVINALLGNEILPADVGHVTNCFIIITGVDEEAGYLTLDNGKDKVPKERLNVQKLCELANAHESSTALAADLYLHLPNKEYKLLANDLVLIDSPGIDVDDELDAGISRNCDDSDVFLLVVNGGSTVSLVEKKFLKRVSDTLMKPNIYILFNQWDVYENKTSVDLLKKQHLNTSHHLLKCLYDDLPKHNRVFFVSAKRKLDSRMKAKHESDSATNAGNADEFDEFQNSLTEFVTKHALETKCEGHINSGLTMCSELQEVLKATDHLLEKERKKQQDICDEHEKKMDALTKAKAECKIICNDLRNKIKTLIQNKLNNVEVKPLIENKLPGEREFDKQRQQEYKQILEERMRQSMAKIIWERCETDMTKLRNDFVDILKGKIAEIRKMMSIEHSDESKSGVTLESLLHLQFTYGDILTAFVEDTSFHVKPLAYVAVAIPLAILFPVGALVFTAAEGFILGATLAAAAAGGGTTGFGTAIGLHYLIWGEKERIEDQFIENAKEHFNTVKENMAKLISDTIESTLHRGYIEQFEQPEHMLKEHVEEADKRMNHLKSLLTKANDCRKDATKQLSNFLILKNEVERCKQH